MSGWSFAAVGCALAAGWLLPARATTRLERITAVPGAAHNHATPLLERVRPPFATTRAATRRRSAILELVDALAAELRSGAAPRDALRLAALDQPLLSGLAAAGRSPAGDVVAALLDVSLAPGGEAARDLAAVWAVCESTGGRLAAPAARLAEALRDQEQVRREVGAQLAGPRATATLLAALPLLGLVMGAALGAHPVRLLVQSRLGPFLLVSGLVLEAVGMLWARRIARRAESL